MSSEPKPPSDGLSQSALFGRLAVLSSSKRHAVLLNLTLTGQPGQSLQPTARVNSARLGRGQPVYRYWPPGITAVDCAGRPPALPSASAMHYGSDGRRQATHSPARATAPPYILLYIIIYYGIASQQASPPPLTSSLAKSHFFIFYFNLS